MSDYGRVSRLRALIGAMEQSAPSEQRDADLRRARNRLSALELAWQEPSAWPSHGQRLSYPPLRRKVRPVFVERADLVLD